MYSYIVFSVPESLSGILIVGVIGGWSPTSVPLYGLCIPFVIIFLTCSLISGVEYPDNF